MDIIAKAYKVRSVLGQGNTGIVYDALRKDGSNVVVKVMHSDLAGDDKIRQRFQRESAKLRKLSGPNIRPILDSGEAISADGEAQLYMARAKVDGPSLAEVFASGELMPVERGLDIVNEICDALRLAHERGIVHRNLKPANVLLERGKGVVVVDFGLSQIVSDSQLGSPDLTAKNRLFGAPEYMAPEQALGEELDARCDVYSVGVLLYEILTGSPPFAGRRPLAILTAHFARDIEAPTARAPAGRVSAELEQVVLRALARDRKDRYESIEAFQDALAEVRKGRARRPTALSAGNASTEPERVHVAPPSRSAKQAGSAKQTGSAKQATLPKQTGSAKQAARPAQAAPVTAVASSSSRSRTWLIAAGMFVAAAVAAGGYWAKLHHYF